MQLVWIRNKRIEIDLVGELQNYSFNRENYSDDKLTCCSPFRYDKKPSFFVNLADIRGMEIAGTWKDSSTDESGNFLQLLAFLRGEPEEETFKYLMLTYEPKAYSEDSRDLTAYFKTVKEFKPLECLLPSLSTWLTEVRGISEGIQKLLDIRSFENTVAFLWKNGRSDIMAIKYRQTLSKIFFYEDGGARLSEQLYAIDVVSQLGATTVAICEAEIDAASWWEYNRAAVALGGASISREQIDLLKRAGVQNVILSFDNDKAGKKLEKYAVYLMSPFFKLFRANLRDCKDVNEYHLKYSEAPKVQRIHTALRIKNKSDNS